MDAAFQRLQHVVTPDDARSFCSTTLQDVFDTARAIERQLAASQSLRNLRRIQPFLNGIQEYTKVVDILCNGTPFLPWAWAPVKLMLQLSVDHVDVIDKLVAAYGQIAAVLPRYDRLGTAFMDNHDIQQVLAMVYSDILEFHERAYKFLRRAGEVSLLCVYTFV